MSIQRIKIHQIRKQETVKRLTKLLNSNFDSMLIALRWIRSRNSFSCKDIVDLTNRDNILTDISQRVHYRWFWRLHSIVMPVWRPNEFPWFANIWTSNHATNREFWSHRQLTGYFTSAVQLFEWNDIFMCSKLEYAVRRGIDNPSTGFHLLFAVFNKNLRTGSRFIPDYLTTSCRFELLNQFCWKTVRIRIERNLNLQPH
ncbi:hypothetical protein D3C78_872970 [compost metagenome]